MRTSSRVGGLVVVAAMVGAFLSVSCTATTSTPSVATMSGTTTKPYGSLRVAGSYGAGPIDPVRTSASIFDAIGVAIFDSLVEMRTEMKYVPGIAERWEISPDGKTHTFFIRKGVKFHNGDDLTGADVKFSIEKMVGPQSTYSEAAQWRVLGVNVELKDAYTVAIQLKQPQYTILIGMERGMGAVMPKKYIEEKGYEYFQENLVGSGPFRVVRLAAGPRVELEAVESHWRAVPKFRNIEVLYVPEDATKIAMLKTGELDLAEVAADSMPELKAAGLRIFSYDAGYEFQGTHFYDIQHPEKYPQGDVRVRKAMQLAVDNKEIASTIFRGAAAPNVLKGVSASAYFFDPSVLKPVPFDPDQAKKLLTEAEYPNGFDTRIYDTRPGTVNSVLNQAISGYWRKVGIRAGLVPFEYAAFLNMYRPKHSPDIWPSVWTLAGTKCVDFQCTDIYDSVNGSVKNHANAKLNELIWAVSQTADPAERKRIALEAMRVALNEHSLLVLLSVYTNVSMSAKIGEVAPVTGRLLSARIFETITHVNK